MSKKKKSIGRGVALLSEWFEIIDKGGDFRPALSEWARVNVDNIESEFWNALEIHYKMGGEAGVRLIALLVVPIRAIWLTERMLKFNYKLRSGNMTNEDLQNAIDTFVENIDFLEDPEFQRASIALGGKVKAAMEQMKQMIPNLKKAAERRRAAGETSEWEW